MGRASFGLVGMVLLVGCGATPAQKVRGAGESESGARRATARVVVGRSAGFTGAMHGKAGRRVGGEADLDGDGRPDRWRVRYEGGSGFGGASITVELTGGAPPFTLDEYGSFGDFLTAIPRPAVLASNAALEVRLVARLFGPHALRRLAYSTWPRAPGSPAPVGASPDLSFEWLVDWRLWPPLPAAAPFLERRVVHPRWAAGPPAPPRSQVAVLGPQLGGRLLRAVRPDEPSAADSKASGALLAYHAQKHGALRRGPRCGLWTLYVTKHGVAVHERARNVHAWAFVSTGVEELRWRSVQRVACDGSRGLVVVERSRRPDRELWVARPRTGYLGRLPLPDGATWKLRTDGTLLVGRTRYSLDDLKRALRHDESQADLDGDGQPDRVEVTFTGGAHCCYRYTLHSSRAKRSFVLPIHQDGGLVGPQTRAWPERSLLADFDGDKLPDLYLRIDTRNGFAEPLSPELTRLGVRTHRVVVSLAGGKLRIRDLQ